MKNHRAPALAFVALILACGDSPTATEAVLFTVEVSGETFRVRATEPAIVDALDARLRAGRRGVISGRLVRGDGGFNGPWSWHLDPASLEVPDFAIELCDGRPSMVEADLDYWFDRVGSFCPWGALVVRRDD